MVSEVRHHHTWCTINRDAPEVYHTDVANCSCWCHTEKRRAARRAEEVIPVGRLKHFDSVNDFMFYTHDVLDMHRGLMIPGCIYCTETCE